MKCTHSLLTLSGQKYCIVHDHPLMLSEKKLILGAVVLCCSCYQLEFVSQLQILYFYSESAKYGSVTMLRTQPMSAVLQKWVQHCQENNNKNRSSARHMAFNKKLHILAAINIHCTETERNLHNNMHRLIAYIISYSKKYKHLSHSPPFACETQLDRHPYLAFS